MSSSFFNKEGGGADDGEEDDDKGGSCVVAALMPGLSRCGVSKDSLKKKLVPGSSKLQINMTIHPSKHTHTLFSPCE